MSSLPVHVGEGLRRLHHAPAHAARRAGPGRRASCAPGWPRGSCRRRSCSGRSASRPRTSPPPRPRRAPSPARSKKFPGGGARGRPRAPARGRAWPQSSDEVNPAYRSFAKFVRDEYEPHGPRRGGRVVVAAAATERYAFHDQGDDHDDPDRRRDPRARPAGGRAHRGGELGDRARSSATPTSPRWRRRSRRTPRSTSQSRQADPRLVPRVHRPDDPKLPSLFGRLPKAKLEVLPVEEFREKSCLGRGVRARGRPTARARAT